MALRRMTADDRLYLRFRRTGDARALGRLFDRTAPELLKLALYLSGDRGRAEELVQRTFLAAIERRDAFDEARPVLPWLLGILTNHARKQVREERRHVALDEHAAASPGPGARAEEQELREALAAVRAGIHDPYRQVLELHLDHGLTAGEIAEVLRRPAGTVRTQIARGLELVRKRLPRGFVAGVTAAAIGRSSLAAVRAEVLAHAAASGAVATAGAAAGTGVLMIGGIAMTQKTAVSVGGALALLLALPVAWGLGAFEARPEPVTREASAMTAESPVSVETRGGAAAARNRSAVDAGAAPVPAAADGAIVRVRLRWKHDGSPAAKVGVKIITWDGANPFLRASRALTDERGEHVFEGVRTGRAGVYPALGGGEQLTLAPGEQRSVELEVERKGIAEGVVVDPNGAPVEGARVWVSEVASWSSGFEVVSTGADGRFSVPLGGDHYVGARKAGRVPSMLRWVLPGEPGEVIRLRLDLRGPAVGLTGVVLDPRGRPLSGAQLRIGPEHSISTSTINDEERLSTPAGRLLETDREGRFALREIEPGNVLVAARAVGCAPWSKTVEVAEGATAELRIQLLAGATVRGRVLDGAGRPVDEAVISYGGYAEFGSRRATTGPDGCFELDSLPIGAVTLRASEQEAGKISASLALAAGSVTEWNPLLRRGSGIAGRVVGEDGRPVAGVRVAAVEPGQPWTWERSAETEADGGFDLPNLDMPAYILRVFGEGDSFVPLLERSGVANGSGGVVLRLLDAHRATARLRGRVLGPDGDPVSKASLAVHRPGANGGRLLALGRDGSFELGPWPPGIYEVVVVVPGRVSQPVGSFRLDPDEARDLGTIRVEEPGELALEVRDAAGQPVATGYVSLSGEHGATCGGTQVEQGEARIERVPPGRYLVQLHTDKSGVAAALVDVASGAVARAVLAIEDGVTCKITLDAEAGTDDLGFARVLVRDPTGQLVRAALLPAGQSAATLETVLPPGRYDIECLAAGGRSGSTTIDVPRAATGDGPVFTLDVR